ncbi:peptide/nickel transport system ATP-binding protein [Paramicrobacterium humi]|uniref:Peptide/nickel transport system ATP-binding protein n=1 Tax=Paramicrobacterium humi TaxID=640635 RepID=A0A1H4Q7M7_9MICO|nr:ABC transporter ATP-binding protein [Microbacterium humi]SEC15580.1 peptide/nickel transport system ATP-binding protein [Microbacterium humi]
MTRLLNVESLRVRFGARHVLNGVSFHVDAGECVAIVGESGSGKSVAMRSLLGLSGGTVAADAMSLGDIDLRALDARGWRKVRGGRIGLVLQDALASLDPLRPVSREIEEALALHTSLTALERRTRVRDLLELVGMPEPDSRARQRPGELSGGLRQRALIASAIAADPELLIADEPTTALDVSTQARILALLGRLRDEGTGILLVSHDLSVVSEIADRVIVLDAGRVVETGQTADVYASPASPVTRALLAAVPGPVPRGRSLMAPAQPAADSAAPGPVVVTAESVTVSFPRRGAEPIHAVRDASLELRRGMTVGLVGESGSGKSTLARVILALQAPTSGNVLLAGAPWSAVPERRRRESRRRLSLVQQDTTSSFDPRWSVQRTIADALPGGIRSTERRRRVHELLADVQLEADVAERMPSELSGGQRQRVAIARALAAEPEILVLDEPVSALDVTVQARILDLFDRLQREHALGYLLISHDLGVIRHMSDEVLVMRDGAIVERGDTESVLAAPGHDYTRALLADTPGLT